MKAFKAPLVLMGMVSITALGVLAVAVSGDDRVVSPKGTGSAAKGPVIPPVIPARPIRDVGKRAIELPTKRLIAARSSTNSTAARADNPKVEPGKVRWHRDFAAACAASTRSKKPVMLFHMMGKLDDQFC
jgi:hypothetical protein